MAIPLMWDPASGSWVPEDRGRTPMEVVQVPSPSAQAEAIASRVTALEQRIASPFEFDAGSMFPYGSQWWLGYTYGTSTTGVFIHNVGLHYNRGYVSGGTSPVFFAIGATGARIGFAVSLVDGSFTAIPDMDASGASDSYGADYFVFPVYTFDGYTIVPGIDIYQPAMTADFVHGSNIGW